MVSTTHSTRTTVLGLGGLLASVAIAACFVLFGRGSGPVPMQGDRPLTAEQLAQVDRITAPILDGVNGDAETADDEIARTELDPIAMAGDGPILQVVETATSRPVPGAEVFFADDRTTRIDRRNRGRRHWADQVVEVGARLVANAEGRVALPPVQRRMFVVGRTDQLFGVATLDRDAKEATIRLEVEQTVTVRVTDAEDRPRAGVEVILAVDRIRTLDARARAETDADGLAELRHTQLYRAFVPVVDPAALAQFEATRNRVASLEQVARMQNTAQIQVTAELRNELRLARNAARLVERAARDRFLPDRSRGRAAGPPAPRDQRPADFVVSARVPQLTPAIVRFAANAVPTRVLDLRLGTLGALTVELVGPGDEPLWTPCRIELRRNGANPLPSTVAPAMADILGRLATIQQEKPAGADRVRFEPIGAGVLLDVSVRFADNDFSFEQTAVPGPVASEERTLRLRVPDWFAALSGRLVDRDGKPWSELRTELLVAGAAGRIEGERVTTDAAGQFELPIRVGEGSPPYSLEVQARQGEQALGAMIAVERLEPGRRHDLGDIIVAPLPVLASGVVRDDRGETIRGADLSLQTFHPGVGDGGAWREVAFVRARSDDEGTFRLYGEPRPERMRVRAQMRGHARVDSPDIPFGATVDLSLTRLGEIVASGQAPEWLPRNAMQIVLTRSGRHDPNQQQVRNEGLRTRRGGGFRSALRNLEPGVYDLTYSLRGIGLVAEQLGIVVEPGETTTLQALDLRDAVFRYVVRAQDQAGQPLRDPGSPLLAQVVDPATGPRWVAFPWRGERVEFYSTSRASTVALLGSGLRPVRTEIAPGESLLTITRLNPIELELPGLREMVGDRRVRVSMVYDGDTGLPMADLEAIDQARGRNRGYPRASLGKSSGAWLGNGSDVVRMNLMLNGRYRVIARISEEGRRGNVSKPIGTVEAVLDRADVQRIVVAPPPSVIQQALIELASR